ncbi:winged helix-turn-helix domain-containing protein [Methanobrevibacter millerae]|uniref:AAA domain-containing protein, putative AbiEii toxin, Type IV TA system n=1 Tax=Methanobrevibacter millerae TaxID=230361 RepID=A0A1G5VHA6_9EURY|nr:winged helix-turn-helix domain-containing protein [Methanobrevibacter millerae]SDA45078.1 AAA domain-containing protein, putative AbiEii toxin, Type IV TA system [Methanobrevibacter millerae]
MSLPKYKDFLVPVLEFFKDNRIHSKNEVSNYLIDLFELTDEDINQKNNTGKVSIFNSRVNRAISDLVRSDLLKKEKRSIFQISEEGLLLSKKDSEEIQKIIIKKIRSSRRVRPINDSLDINIKSFGAISESKMDIGKINVVGGQNATGKSTTSKLLYCFLKYSSANRQKEAYESVIDQIESLFLMSRRLYPLREGFNFAEFFHKTSLNTYEMLELYGKFKEFVYDEEFDEVYPRRRTKTRIFDEIEEIDKLIEIIEEDGIPLFNLIMNNLLESEFSNKMKGYVEFKGVLNGNEFKFSSNFSNGYNFNKEGELFINDVFYIDSFSSLDINQINGLNNTNHVQSLLKAFNKKSDESYDLFDPIKNPNIRKLEKDINTLLKGKFHYEDNELKYSDDYGITCSMSNTASGIKQIGIIQLLLGYRKLKPNSFLIIDEPEVNLHPEWQIKLAEILVILAKNLDVKIYINTHSPMFIEAMSLYSEYYGLLNDTNVYLTEKHKLGGFTFKKIDPKDMGAVYENLSRPYDDLDKIKSKLIFRS